MRERLPAERPAINKSFSVGGTKGTASVSLFEDGRPGELFIKYESGASSEIAGMTTAVATLTSIALQHGAPMSTLVDKMRHTRFEPAGLTGDPDQRMATSILDYIFGWLERSFVLPEVVLTDGAELAIEAKEK